MCACFRRLTCCVILINLVELWKSRSSIVSIVVSYLLSGQVVLYCRGLLGDLGFVFGGGVKHRENPGSKHQISMKVLDYWRKTICS